MESDELMDILEKSHSLFVQLKPQRMDVIDDGSQPQNLMITPLCVHTS